MSAASSGGNSYRSLSTGATGSGLVLDAVQTGYEHRRERQVRVARRVRHAELDALGLAFEPVIGIRIQAERLRCEYTRFTGASNPAPIGGTSSWSGW